MKRNVLLLLLFQICVALVAMPKDTIALQNVTKNDTAAINILFEQFKKYYYASSDSALFFAHRGLELSEKLNSQENIALFHNAIAQYYLQKKDYPNSLSHHLTALKIREQLKNKKDIASSFNNIGLVYQSIGNNRNALIYFSKSLEINQQLDNKEGVAHNANNLAIIYSKEKKYDLAILFGENALEIWRELSDSLFLAATLNNIGNFYNEKMQYDLALNYYQESIAISNIQNDSNNISIRFYNIGSIYDKKKQKDSALYYFNKSLIIANKINNKELISANHLSLSGLLAEKEKYKAAYEHHLLFYTYADSVFNEKISLQISEMQTKYETEKKQKEIELLNKEKEKQAALSLVENKRKNTIIFSIIGGLVLVTLFSIFLFKRFRVTNQQKIVIEEKQKEITDSITYAKRIQEAILPPESIIKNLLPNSFFLYKPKDIVSGDFYWLEQKDNKILFAAVDCTGHGVPGAFVSIVGHNGLTRAINEFDLSQPAQILNKLNELVEETLRQKDNEVRDGMDISLCSIDFSNNQLQYAGANNPLYLVRNGEIIITKADKQPIGGTGENKTFTNHVFELQKNDTIYLFSDGFPDQFGGIKDKKYGYKQFRKLLLSIQNKPMLEQLNLLDTEFNNWKGEAEQLDDVCVIGVKI